MREIRRTIWYSHGLLAYAGGGVRLMLEGLKYFNDHGVESVLLTHQQPSSAALFDGLYRPEIRIPQYNRSLIYKVPILRFISGMILSGKIVRQYKPDYLIAIDHRSAFFLWLIRFFSGNRTLPIACFLHGSFYQFPRELIKHSLKFRSRYKAIVNSDPVYQDIYSQTVIKANIFQRIKAEIQGVAYYSGVRKSRIVFVLTEKNRYEIGLLFHHDNIKVLHGAIPNELMDMECDTEVKQRLNLADRKVFLTVSLLWAKKRVDLIIGAFAKYLQGKDDAVLLIGGEGEEKEKLIRLAASQGISRNVIFLGHIPESQLNAFYCACDVFISADSADYDISTIYAIGLGKKVVVSVQNIFEEKVRQLKSIYPTFPTVDQYADSLRKAASDDQRTDPQILREAMKTYTWEYYFSSILSELANPA
jgi:glycosyltransferase involved in cell wall biosynthesis